MINITFPDGSVRQYEAGVTGLQIAESISSRLAQDVLACGVNGETVELNRPINEDASIQLYKWDDKEAKHAFWHTSAHLMAEALQELLLYVGKYSLSYNNTFSGHYIIIETIFYSRTYAELSAGVEFLQCLSHQVGAGVPEGMLALLVIPLEELYACILVDGAVQFHGFSVHSACKHILSQTAADAFCNLKTGDSCFVLAHRAIGKSDIYHFVVLCY